MSDTTNPESQKYSADQRKSYPYNPSAYTQSNKTYTPSNYTSSYKTDADPSNSDPKRAAYRSKTTEGQINPSYTQSGGSIEASNKGSTPTNTGATYTVGISANYRPYTGSTDTASLTTENPSLLNASNTSHKPTDLNPALIQPIYQELQHHIGGGQGKLVTGTSLPHHSGIDPPPNTNTFTSPLLKPSQNSGPSSFKTDGPLLKLDSTGQDPTPTRDPNRTYSYKKPEQAQETYSSYNPTPSNKYTVSQQERTAQSYGGPSSYKLQTTAQTDQNGGYTRSYTQPPTGVYPRDASKKFTLGSSFRPTESNQQAQDQESVANLNIGGAVDRTGAYDIKVTASEEPQGQAVFANPMFGETARSEFNEEYKIAATEPNERRSNRLGGELAKSVVDVRYELPGWYDKDKDTELYENMYLIDAIRYTNRRVISQSPARGSEKGMRASQMVGANQNSHDNYHNFSHKLETPKSAKKWDRHIPRVILFVHKYNAGEMEDDDNEEINLGQSLDYQNPDHSSPYYLETHQQVYYENNRPSQVGRISLEQQQPKRKSSRDGFFDVNQYITLSHRTEHKEPETDIGFFEENEGVRQSIRIKDIPSRLSGR